MLKILYGQTNWRFTDLYTVYVTCGIMLFFLVATFTFSFCLEPKSIISTQYKGIWRVSVSSSWEKHSLLAVKVPQWITVTTHKIYRIVILSLLVVWWHAWNREKWNWDKSEFTKMWQPLCNHKHYEFQPISWTTRILLCWTGILLCWTVGNTNAYNSMPQKWWR